MWLKFSCDSSGPSLRGSQLRGSQKEAAITPTLNRFNADSDELKNYIDQSQT